MASDKRPIKVEELDQKQFEDFPPAYNEATGTLDLQRDGLNAQTQMGSQCIVLLLSDRQTYSR